MAGRHGVASPPQATDRDRKVDPNERRGYIINKSGKDHGVLYCTAGYVATIRKLGYRVREA